MTEIEQVLFNLSAYRYGYITIYENALSQLDHIFSTVGNGYDYSAEHGIVTRNENTGKLERLNQPIDFDFAAFKEKHDRLLAKQQESLDELISIFGDKIPPAIYSIYDVSNSIYAQEFKVQPEEFYFDPEVVASQFIEYVKKENQRSIHRDKKYVGTPYPLSGNYSLINHIRPTDDPIVVRLALSTYKSWLIVLDWHIQNGVYLTAEEVQKYGDSAYYDSLEYIQKTIENVQSIVKVLENNHE